MRIRVSTMFFPLFFFFFSCGMEDYIYFPSVDEGNINLVPNTTATIVLPRRDQFDDHIIDNNYFTTFSLFYRIYISDVNIITTYPYYVSDLFPINSNLASDFSALSSYTLNTATVITDLGSRFSARKYYTLELENTEIEDVLSPSALGNRITLDFSSGKAAPVLGIQASLAAEPVYYTLRRTGGGGNFYPVPSDRRLLNTQDLNSSVNATAAINNDVMDKSSAIGHRYTYVSIYIVTTGKDDNFTPLYSRPTHIGIFSLPEP